MDENRKDAHTMGKWYVHLFYLIGKFSICGVKEWPKAIL